MYLLSSLSRIKDSQSSYIPSHLRRAVGGVVPGLLQALPLERVASAEGVWPERWVGLISELKGVVPALESPMVLPSMLSSLLAGQPKYSYLCIYCNK